ncbi:MAG: hypothetical protein U1G07_00865 [Verrucomicrobiota bacterium]
MRSRLYLAGRGFVTLELIAAIGLLTAAMLPMAYSIIQEQRLARAYYYRALVMEIIDGEIEVLAAGQWRAYPVGRQSYTVHAAAATNLPPGVFTLNRQLGEVQLEWQPAKAGKGGRLTRAFPLQTNSVKAPTP